MPTASIVPSPDFPSPHRLLDAQARRRIGPLTSRLSETVLTQVLASSPLLLPGECKHIPGSHVASPDASSPAPPSCPSSLAFHASQLHPSDELARAVATRVFGCDVAVFRSTFAATAPIGIPGGIPASTHPNPQLLSPSPHETPYACGCSIPMKAMLTDPAQHHRLLWHTIPSSIPLGALAPYPSDMGWAWRIVEKMAQRGRTHGFYWSLRHILNTDDQYSFDDLGYAMIEEDHVTLSTAICLAALHALDDPSTLDRRDDDPGVPASSGHPGVPPNHRSYIERAIDAGLTSTYPPEHLQHSPENRARAISHRPPPYGVICQGCGQEAFLTNDPPLLQAPLTSVFIYDGDLPALRPISLVPSAHHASSPYAPLYQCQSCAKPLSYVRSAAGGWQAYPASTPE